MSHQLYVHIQYIYIYIYVNSICLYNILSILWDLVYFDGIRYTYCMCISQLDHCCVMLVHSWSVEHRCSDGAQTREFVLVWKNSATSLNYDVSCSKKCKQPEAPVSQRIPSILVSRFANCSTTCWCFWDWSKDHSQVTNYSGATGRSIIVWETRAPLWTQFFITHVHLEIGDETAKLGYIRKFEARKYNLEQRTRRHTTWEDSLATSVSPSKGRLLRGGKR